MELVLLIAVGIVVGVILLAFLPFLLNLAAVVVVIGLAIAAVVFAVSFPDLALTYIGGAIVFVVLGVALFILFGDGGIAHRVGNRRYASEYYSLFEYQVQELKNEVWTTVDGSPARTVALSRAKELVALIKSEKQKPSDVTTEVRVIRKQKSDETELVRWEV